VLRQLRNRLLVCREFLEVRTPILEALRPRRMGFQETEETILSVHALAAVRPHSANIGSPPAASKMSFHTRRKEKKIFLVYMPLRPLRFSVKACKALDQTRYSREYRVLPLRLPTVQHFLIQLWLPFEESYSSSCLSVSLLNIC
jgi:hypothetical protein